VPIVVGGTHYYLEALLWENVLLHAIDAPLVAKNQHQHEGDSEETVKHGEEKGTSDPEPTLAKLYERLMQVDPLMASYLHPHNERKIKRALEVFDATGRPYSDQLRQQAPPTPRCRPPPSSAARACEGISLTGHARADTMRCCSGSIATRPCCTRDWTGASIRWCAQGCWTR
jgi:hypothetical protein